MRALGAFSTMTFKKVDKTAINTMPLWVKLLGRSSLGSDIFFFFVYKQIDGIAKKTKIARFVCLFIFFFFNFVKKNWLERKRASRCNYHMISSFGVGSPCVRFNCLANEKTFSLFGVVAGNLSCFLRFEAH